MPGTHKGACLCGAVSYKARGSLREVIFCHCSQCRRQTGLYYASTNVANEDIEIEGADNITWYRASKSAARGFCKHCGSALFWKYDGEDHISIQAGSLEKPTGLVAGYHIFCADKGDFYEINDGLPQYAQGAVGQATNEG